jgi:hypothetical protein
MCRKWEDDAILTKFGTADEDLFDEVRNAEAGERVPMMNGECAEADVNFADDEIDVPMPMSKSMCRKWRDGAILMKFGNADGGLFDEVRNADTDERVPMTKVNVPRPMWNLPTTK